MYTQILLAILISTSLVLIKCQQTDNDVNNPFLLISFDGFRWDYLTKAKLAGYNTSNFDRLIQSGVSLQKPGLINSFITVTYPNHYSLVTGMYEQNHGIVGNKMFDLTTGEIFAGEVIAEDNKKEFWFNNGTFAYNNDSRYIGPQPIWNRNQMFSMDNYKRKSGVMFWPGSEVAIDGHRPFLFKEYNASLPNKTRIDTVIGWFMDTDNPINLGLLYFEEPDEKGHVLGSDDPQMMELIEALDGIIGYLIEELERVDLFEKINIIITADHGMTNIRHIIEVDEHIDPGLYKYYGESPVWHILPNLNKEQEVLDHLSKIPHVTVYKKHDIPKEYHYTYNQRIMPIIMEADEEYGLCKSKADPQCYTDYSGGDHGYNNSLPSMHPLFIAHGPAFKKNYIAKTFRNVDIYPLMCHILNITPPENIDGILSRVQHILYHHDPQMKNVYAMISTISLSIIFVAVCIFSAWKAISHVRKTQGRLMQLPLHDIYNDSEQCLLESVSDEEDEDDTTRKNRPPTTKR